MLKKLISLSAIASTILIAGCDLNSEYDLDPTDIVIPGQTHNVFVTNYTSYDTEATWYTLWLGSRRVNEQDYIVAYRCPFKDEAGQNLDTLDKCRTWYTAANGGSNQVYRSVSMNDFQTIFSQKNAQIRANLTSRIQQSQTVLSQKQQALGARVQQARTALATAGEQIGWDSIGTIEQEMNGYMQTLQQTRADLSTQLKFLGARQKTYSRLNSINDPQISAELGSTLSRGAALNTQISELRSDLTNVDNAIARTQQLTQQRLASAQRDAAAAERALASLEQQLSYAAEVQQAAARNAQAAADYQTTQTLDEMGAARELYRVVSGEATVIWHVSQAQEAVGDYGAYYPGLAAALGL